MRDRCWRRAEKERWFQRQYRQRYEVSYWYSPRFDPRLHSDITYHKRNSIYENLEVSIQTESHWRDFLELRAKKARDNRKQCNCWSCSSPRSQGLGNSREIYKIPEARALMAAVQEIADCETRTPNSTWRKRKYKTSTH